jgi:acetyltransferase-like isoleucine patch superfamily enzyme
MPEVTAVTVPLLGANEDSVLVARWLVTDGERVKAGQPVCDVETTKTAIALEAGADGVVLRVVEAGEEARVGSAVALIGPDLETLRRVHGERDGAGVAGASPARGEARATSKAAALARSLGIDLAEVAASGVIRERDVLRHHQSRTPGPSAGPAAAAAAPVETPRAGRVDPEFLSYVRANRKRFAKLDSEFKLLLYRRFGARIGAGVVLGRGSLILAEHVEIGDGVILEDRCVIECASVRLGALGRFRSGFECRCRHLEVGAEAFFARNVVVGRGGSDEPTAVLKVGDRTFVGEDVLLNTGMPIAIGDECFVGQSSAILTHNIGHSYLHGFDNAFAPVRIGDRVQIGVNCFVYPGVVVGDEVVVISNSAVILGVPAGKLVAGVPAKVVRDARKNLSERERRERFQTLQERFKAMLVARGIEVWEEEGEPGRTFRFCHEGEEQRVTFSEAFVSGPGSSARGGVTTIVALEGGDAPVSPAVLFDLTRRRVVGQPTPVSEGVREFLRKAGIKLEPWPWRYQGGIL